MGEASQTRKVVPAFGKELCVLAWPHGPLPSLFFPLLRSADIINLVEFLGKKEEINEEKVEKKEEKKWRKKRRKKERKRGGNEGPKVAQCACLVMGSFASA